MSRIRCYSVGRDPSMTIVVQHGTVSRRHAELIPVAGGQVYVTDCASANGTFVAEGGRWHEISQRFVHAGGRLRFGNVEFSVQQLLADIARLPAAEGQANAGPAGAREEKQLDASRGVARDPGTGEPVALGRSETR